MVRFRGLGSHALNFATRVLRFDSTQRKDRQDVLVVELRDPNMTTYVEGWVRTSSMSRNRLRKAAASY